MKWMWGVGMGLMLVVSGWAEMGPAPTRQLQLDLPPAGQLQADQTGGVFNSALVGRWWHPEWLNPTGWSLGSGDEAAACGPWYASEITFNSQLVSNYLWYGRDVFSGPVPPSTANFQDPSSTMCYQPSMDLFLPRWGVGFNVWGNWALENRSLDNGNFRDADELDYTVYLKHTLNDMLELKIAYIYYDLYRLPSIPNDIQEFQFTLAGVGCPVITPYYTLHSMFGYGSAPPAVEDGTLHEFGFTWNYDLPFSTYCGEAPYCQPLALTVKTVYDDGWNFSAFGPVTPGWAYTVGDLSTSFAMGPWFTFTPGVAYQWTHNSRINDEDEWVAYMGLSYTMPVGMVQ